LPYLAISSRRRVRLAPCNEAASFAVVPDAMGLQLEALKTGDYTITVRGIDTAGKVREPPSFFGRLFRSFPAGVKALRALKSQGRTMNL
jgi:hypothetical protein